MWFIVIKTLAISIYLGGNSLVVRYFYLNIFDFK